MTREQDTYDTRRQAFDQLDRLRDHWYRRPGWRAGRSRYAWHLTFDDARELHALAAEIQRAIDLPVVSLVPHDGLHLTMQGVGFSDEVTDRDVAAIVDAARLRCRDLSPFDLTLGPVDADAEGVGVFVRPWAPVETLRLVLRGAVADVRGARSVPGERDGFRPHVTLAYSSADADPTELRGRLDPLRAMPPVPVRVGYADLIRLRRDDRVYRWDTVAEVELAG